MPYLVNGAHTCRCDKNMFAMEWVFDQLTQVRKCAKEMQGSFFFLSK